MNATAYCDYATSVKPEDVRRYDARLKDAQGRCKSKKISESWKV